MQGLHALKAFAIDLEDTHQPWSHPTVILDGSIDDVGQLFRHFGSSIFDAEHRHLNPIEPDTAYFGLGFDGFADCLASLYVLPFESFHVVHHHLPDLDPESLRLDLECLDGFCAFRRSADINLQVVFAAHLRPRVETLLGLP